MLNPDFIGTGSFQDLDFVILNPDFIGTGSFQDLMHQQIPHQVRNDVQW
jgi:hypothetical protein